MVHFMSDNTKFCLLWLFVFNSVSFGSLELYSCVYIVFMFVQVTDIRNIKGVKSGNVLTYIKYVALTEFPEA